MEEFIVFDTYMDRYIAGIDQYDGETSDTADPAMARIFRGATWGEFWTEGFERGRYRLESVPEVERCPRDIES